MPFWRPSCPGEGPTGLQVPCGLVCGRLSDQMRRQQGPCTCVACNLSASYSHEYYERLILRLIRCSAPRTVPASAKHVSPSERGYGHAAARPLLVHPRTVCLARARVSRHLASKHAATRLPTCSRQTRPQPTQTDWENSTLSGQTVNKSISYLASTAQSKRSLSGFCNAFAFASHWPFPYRWTSERSSSSSSGVHCGTRPSTTLSHSARTSS